MLKSHSWTISSSSNVFDITLTSPVGEIIVDSPSCTTPSSVPALAT